jgi:AbrB family looped-hinge helix DNA binding protein
MYTSTISSKYQVVIPREVREKYAMKPGQKLLFVPYKNTLRVVIVPSIEQARGMFKGLDTDNHREEDDEDRG